MAQAVKHVRGHGKHQVRQSSRAGRIQRLRERLEVEEDPKVPAMIEAQLWALRRPFGI